MRKIFKSFISLTLVLMFVAFSAIPALAADYKSETDFKVQADRLNSLGLFIGTNNGYELERIPTRAEAAVMLVRLLGKENEVKAGTYVHPFKDVPQWVDKYVGYLYDNGLTKGTTAKTFEPDEVCSVQMYSAFVLRALGYTEDGGDYIYNEAEDFTYQLGLRLMSFNDAFLRDDMVALSYSALFQYIKDSDDTLFDILISQNAVNEDTAQKMRESYDIYKEYVAACEASYIDVSTYFTNKQNADIVIDGEKISIYQEDLTQSIVENGKVRFMNITNTIFDGYTTFVTFYADGWLYYKFDDQKLKEQWFISLDDYIQSINLTAMPFYMINNISKSTDNNGKNIYSVIYSTDIYDDLYSNGINIINDLPIYEIEQAQPLHETTMFTSYGKLYKQIFTEQIQADINLDGQVYPISVKTVSERMLVGYGIYSATIYDYNPNEFIDINS